jgi:hypothetical protein
MFLLANRAESEVLEGGQGKTYETKRLFPEAKIGQYRHGHQRSLAATTNI